MPAVTAQRGTAMACNPTIDQPCPLGVGERRRIAGFCAHCSKAVHSLDGMDDAGRIAFLRNAKGPLCETYRVAARGAALGLGATLVLAAPPGKAQDVDAPSPSQVDTATRASPADSSDHELDFITVGGASDPAAVEFIDASDALPELPVVHEASGDDALR
jgi:hypothetical protein